MRRRRRPRRGRPRRDVGRRGPRPRGHPRHPPRSRPRLHRGLRARRRGRLGRPSRPSRAPWSSSWASLRDDPAAAGQGATSENVAPLGGLSSARLHVRSGLSSLRLRAGRDASELYRAAFEGATPQVRLRDGRVLVQYRGLPFDWRKRKATFGLNPTIPWTIEIVGGIQRVEADLRDVDIETVRARRRHRADPAGARRAARRGPVRIVGGAKHDPARAAARGPRSAEDRRSVSAPSSSTASAWREGRQVGRSSRLAGSARRTATTWRSWAARSRSRSSAGRSGASRRPVAPRPVRRAPRAAPRAPRASAPFSANAPPA